MLKMKKESWRKLLFTNIKRFQEQIDLEDDVRESRLSTLYTKSVHSILVFLIVYVIVCVCRGQNYGKKIDEISTITCRHIHRFLFANFLHDSMILLSAIFVAYFSDFGLRNFFLFPKMKNIIRGEHLRNIKTGNDKDFKDLLKGRAASLLHSMETLE